VSGHVWCLPLDGNNSGGTGSKERTPPGMSEPLAIARAPISSPDATTLIARLDTELRELYPDSENSHPELTATEVSGGHGVFLIARRAGEPVGCGALCRLDGSTGEIRRMYVLPSARGAGVGRHLLTELERNAEQMGLQRLILITGIRQPVAIRMYESSGFNRAPVPSEHQKYPVRVYMIKELTTLSHATCREVLNKH
jgi:putative acetyltransferase